MSEMASSPPQTDLHSLRNGSFLGITDAGGRVPAFAFRSFLSWREMIAVGGVLTPGDVNDGDDE